ncbi:hypothetical protein A2U01_0115687, partial [Trifolium medium]|nr:hypothetical protein [Trifolium medium]
MTVSSRIRVRSQEVVENVVGRWTCKSIFMGENVEHRCDWTGVGDKGPLEFNE